MSNLPQIRQSIVDFIEVVSADTYDRKRRLSRLVQTLDNLVATVHVVEFTYDRTENPEAPTLDYQQLYATIGKRFPDLGYYNIADPIAQRIGEGQVVVGDGIDDIVDIFKELSEVLWLWENTSANDALWHLTWSFRVHWGMHLRSLQLYLHAVDLHDDATVA